MQNQSNEPPEPTLEVNKKHDHCTLTVKVQYSSRVQLKEIIDALLTAAEFLHADGGAWNILNDLQEPIYPPTIAIISQKELTQLYANRPYCD